MAHFYASIKGTRDSLATKTGSKSSGMDAHIRGWHSGIRVACKYNEKTGRDEFYVYRTSGSNGGAIDQLIYTSDGQVQS